MAHLVCNGPPLDLYPGYLFSLQNILIECQSNIVESLSGNSKYVQLDFENLFAFGRSLLLLSPWLFEIIARKSPSKTFKKSEYNNQTLIYFLPFCNYIYRYPAHAILYPMSSSETGISQTNFLLLMGKTCSSS